LQFLLEICTKKQWLKIKIKEELVNENQNNKNCCWDAGHNVNNNIAMEYCQFFQHQLFFYRMTGNALLS
jgi:hypothetical protein